MTPQESALDRSVLATSMRDLAKAIDSEVGVLGDSEAGETSWELSAQALRLPGDDYPFTDWHNSDFAAAARVFAFLLDNTDMVVEEIYPIAIEQVEESWPTSDAHEAGVERAEMTADLFEAVDDWIDAGAPNADELMPAFENVTQQLVDNVGLPDDEFNRRAAALIDDMIDQFDGAVIDKQEGDEVELDEALAEALAEAELDDDLDGYYVDASDEEARVYIFATENGGTAEVEIEQPNTVFVCDDGTHCITDVTGVLEIVPPGWLKITIYPFPEHQQVNDVEDAA